MYYAAKRRGGALHCIGAAKASNILGPYTPQPSAMECQDDRGAAIDPSGFQDPRTGYQYVLYKVDGNSLDPHTGGSCGLPVNGYYHPTPIMLQRVRKDDGVTKVSSPVQLLDLGPYDGPLFEAPSMFYKDGVYFLLFSSNCYNTDFYGISYATATSIAGTYTKAGAPLMQTKDGYVRAPGGADVNLSGTLIAFHGTVGKTSNNEPIRCLYAAKITGTGRQISLQAMIN